MPEALLCRGAVVRSLQILTHQTAYTVPSMCVIAVYGAVPAAAVPDVWHGVCHGRCNL